MLSVTPELKVEKWLPRQEMNGLSEGYKRAIDQNMGCMAKIFGFFFAKRRDFGPQKNTHFFTLTMFWPRPEKIVKKKYPFPK